MMKWLRNHFRPEFLNRIDDIILFRNLNKEQIKEIVNIQLCDLKKRMAEQKMSLNVSEEVKEILADKGFDPVYGARPLKRAIQKYLQDPISIKILEEEFSEGDHIRVEKNGTGDSFIFKKSAQ